MRPAPRGRTSTPSSEYRTRISGSPEPPGRAARRSDRSTARPSPQPDQGRGVREGCRSGSCSRAQRCSSSSRRDTACRESRAEVTTPLPYSPDASLRLVGALGTGRRQAVRLGDAVVLRRSKPAHQNAGLLLRAVGEHLAELDRDVGRVTAGPGDRAVGADLVPAPQRRHVRLLVGDARGRPPHAPRIDVAALAPHDDPDPVARRGDLGPAAPVPASSAGIALSGVARPPSCPVVVRGAHVEPAPRRRRP